MHVLIFSALAVLQIAFVAQCSSLSIGSSSKPPNILFFLTDDQDSELGGLEPLSKAKSWIAEKGVSFDNAFVTVPVCCPSRSSILTGLYQQNTKALNNSLEGNCYGSEWTESTEKNTFATSLKSNGYTTYYAGKYLNCYCRQECDRDSELDLTVPPGWDNWAGLCGNSKYYNYTLSVNGEAEEHGDNYETDYLTDVISRKAMDWLADYRKLKDQSDDGLVNPFLMVLATPAPHGPVTPAPKYANEFSDRKAPRTPAFNYVKDGSSDKHWVMRFNSDPLDDILIERVDEWFRNRWRTLLSVDEMIDKVMRELEDMGELDNTFVLFSSDHGYHLGTFGMMWDKRMNYETDVRVPFLIRGPGVMENKTVKDINVNIDIAPTMIEMSGQTINPDDYDGISLLPFVMKENESYLKKDTTLQRNEFIFSYNGEADQELNIETCEDYIKGDHMMSHCKVEWDCKCEDTRNNTYQCKRYLDDQENKVLCRFEDEEDFVEYYDLNKDPYQLYNIPQEELSPEETIWMESALDELRNLE